jgi:hypothetical protein
MTPEWFSGLVASYELPSWARIHALANKLKRKWHKKLDDEDLPNLIYLAVKKAMRYFDPFEPAAQGDSGRRNVPDRFLGYFGRAMVWQLKNQRRQDRLLSLAETRWGNFPAGQCPQQDFVLAHTILACVSNYERRIIESRLWEKASFSHMATEFGLKTKMNAKREFLRVIERIRVDANEGIHPHNTSPC